jgi:hypothetical protein
MGAVPAGATFVWRDKEGRDYDVEVETDPGVNGMQDYRCRRVGREHWLEGMAGQQRMQVWFDARQH